MIEHHQGASMTTEPTHHLRPAAHFAPHSTWMNDPNGLTYLDGTYHVFFQTNPEAATWGNMSWGHATSTDLVTWTEHPIALPFTEQEHIFSGSVVVDHDNPSGFADPTSSHPPMVAIYTSHFTPASPRHGRQAQSVAYSVDGGMTWAAYDANPVLCRDSSDFRDPKVFRWGGAAGYWVMVAVEAIERSVVIYRSDDLVNWSYLSTFDPTHAVDGIWECPDLFEVPVDGTDRRRWVLVVSLNPGGIAGGSGAQYFVGDFDGERFVPERLAAAQTPQEYDWLDFGRDYYAAVSFDNVPGRRLMIGWANNWDYANDIPTAPWRSTMSLVREVDLLADPDGRHRLRQRPVMPQGAPHGVLRLRCTAALGGEAITRVTVTAADGTDPWELIVDGATATMTADRTRCGDVAFHPLFASRDSAPLVTRETSVDIDIIVDGSVIEVYADDGRVCLTQQVFPRGPLTRAEVRTC